MIKFIIGIYNDAKDLSPLLVVICCVGSFILGTHSSPEGIPLSAGMIGFTIVFTGFAAVVLIVSNIIDNWKE